LVPLGISGGLLALDTTGRWQGMLGKNNGKKMEIERCLLGIYL